MWVFLSVLAFAANSCSNVPMEDGEYSAEADPYGEAMLMKEDPNCVGKSNYKVGAGIYDITGPIGTQMMGYVEAGQKANGIKLRLWANTYIFHSPCNGKRVVYMSAETHHIPESIRRKVIIKLQNKYGNLYSDANVMMSATHTHSGPGLASMYPLHNITPNRLEFLKETDPVVWTDPINQDILVNGIFNSIVRAHNNLTNGIVKVNKGSVDLGINRSKQAYANNKDAGNYSSDLYKTMTLLRLEADSGEALAMLNWHALHTTSIGAKDKWIHGDNKGYASWAFMQIYKSSTYQPDSFVGHFAQEAAGDVAPTLTWNKQIDGSDDFPTMVDVGMRYRNKAYNLYKEASEQLAGPVDYRIKWVDFDGYKVNTQYGFGKERTLCPAALGATMLEGGVDDGFGDGFNEAIDVIKEHPVHSGLDFLWPQDLVNCQGNKNIITAPGYYDEPVVPEVLPIQIFRVGQLAIVGLPFECTTMCGRRIRKLVLDIFGQENIHVDKVVVAAYSNGYAQYLTTQEEYDIQEYEGASNYFGRWTLPAVQQVTAELTTALAKGTSVAAGSKPPYRFSSSWPTVFTIFEEGYFNYLFNDYNKNTKVGGVFDNRDVNYGELVYKNRHENVPGDVFVARFKAAHPRNDLNIQSSYFYIERFDPVDKSYTTVLRDRDYPADYSYNASTGVAQIRWKIDASMKGYSYRITLPGNAYVIENMQPVYKPYTGTVWVKVL